MASAGSVPAALRPVLSGTHRREAVTGKMVWEGVWSLHEGDLAFPERCAPFRYERTGTFRPETESQDPGAPQAAPVSQGSAGADVPDGLYSGYFEARLGGPKIQERNVLIHFEGGPEDASLRVTGSGSNRIGKFTLTGSWERSSAELRVVREYGAGQAGNKKRAKAVAAAEPAAAAGASSSSSSSSSSSLELLHAASSPELLEGMLELVEELMAEDRLRWFCAPVDAAALGLADYHSVITRPMDLGTVHSRLKKGQYSSALTARDDVALTFANATHYNPRGHHVYKRAVELEEMFTQRFAQLVAEAGAGADESDAALPISTPAAPPMRLIGKRHSIPKIIFEPATSPQSKRHKVGEPELDAEATAAAKRSPGAQSELEQLRAQVAAMSKHISSLSKAITTGLPVDLPTLDKAEPRKGGSRSGSHKKPPPPSYEFKQQLATDIGSLPEDKIDALVAIIEANGSLGPIAAADEFELDIDALDNDTIYKVRRFVSLQLGL
jgi:hypothetical protein